MRCSALLVSMVLFGVSCGSGDENGESRDCAAGRTCDRIVTKEIFDVSVIQGFLGDGIVAVRFGERLTDLSLWWIGEEGLEKIADDLFDFSVQIDNGRNEVYFGTAPDRSPRDLVDAGYVAVDLHVWRKGEGSKLLANDVLAAYHATCSSGDFMWVWRRIGNWLNCGTIEVVDLRSPRVAPPVVLGEVCRVADDHMPAAFTRDCEDVVAVYDGLRKFSVENPGVEETYDIRSNWFDIAPDGRHVAFMLDDGDGRLEVVRTSDGATVLDRRPARHILLFDDRGSRLLYGVPAANGRAAHLEVLDLDSYSSVELEIDPFGVLPYGVLFSADDARIAIVAPGSEGMSELLVAGLPGGEVQSLMAGNFGEGLLGGWRKNFEWNREMRFSDDGRYLTSFVRYGTKASGLDVSAWVFDLKRGSSWQVGGNVATVGSSISWSLDLAWGTFSPDGRHVAWLSVDRDLFLAGVDGEVGKRVATTGLIRDISLSNERLAWLDDGSGLRYVDLDP